MAGLNAGDQDRRVLIEQLTETEGTSGFPVETWTPLVTVSMKRKDRRSGEAFRSGQLSASFDTEWTTPFRDDLDPARINVPKTRRLVDRGRVHDITAAIEIGRREGLTLLTLASTTV